MSGLVLVTGAAGAGRVRQAAGWPGCCLTGASGACLRTDATPPRGAARQPGAEAAAGDLREIADVEPGAGNHRAVGTATVSSFLNSDAPPTGSGRQVVSARGMGYRCSRAAARPPRGTAQVFFRKVLAGHERRHASPLARHNRAICTQTTEPATKPTQANIRRSAWRARRFLVAVRD